MAKIDKVVKNHEKRLRALEGQAEEPDTEAKEPVYLADLTAKQCTYLSKMARLRKQGQVILSQDDQRWIFVCGTEDIEEHSQELIEGAGVWVDPNGQEHQGPYGTAA